MVVACGQGAAPAPATGPKIATAAKTGSGAATPPHFKDGEYEFRMRHEQSAQLWVLDSERLTLAGSAASLQLDGREPHDGQTGSHVDQWPSVISATMKGTAAWTGDNLDVELVADGANDALRLKCQAAQVDVAPADAVLVVATGSSCKVPAVWSKATKREWVLECESRAGIDPFAPTPGVEQVKPRLSYDEGCDPDAVTLLRGVEPNVIAPVHMP
jgi:hypothetical protein